MILENLMVESIDCDNEVIKIIDNIIVWKKGNREEFKYILDNITLSSLEYLVRKSDEIRQ